MVLLIFRFEFVVGRCDVDERWKFIKPWPEYSQNICTPKKKIERKKSTLIKYFKVVCISTERNERKEEKKNANKF